MTEFVFVYTTAPSSEVAGQIARELIEAKLVACVNVVPHMVAYYEWEGKLQEEAEVQLWCKTSISLQEPVIAAIAAAHPYDCPAILALPIHQIHTPFAEWMKKQLSA